MKKISFISLSRSDYTSLRTLIQHALTVPEFGVEVVTGGSHLLQRFGKSIDKFAEDKIPVNKIVDFLKESDDSDLDIARAAGRAFDLFVEHFNSSKPDYVFILGDRWEMLPVVEAAFLLRIPVIHHSGGDITQGALDNQIRYSISAKSHFHLVGLEEHRERLIRIGEEGWRVVTSGEPALTEVRNVAASVDDIYKELGLKSGEEFVLATFHPTTFDDLPINQQIDLFLESLKQIKLPLVVTAPNPDPGSKYFLDKLNAFAKDNSQVHLFQNLGARLYYAAMSKARFMIGNSSSGLWEAPSFGLPVLNMGQRQNGRKRVENVVDVKLDLAEIKNGIQKVSDPAFKNKINNIVNPYGHEGTNNLIVEAIKKLPSKEVLLHKLLIDPLENKQ